MTNKMRQILNSSFAWFAIATMIAAPVAAFAQTQISAPSNKYSVNDDIKLGQPGRKSGAAADADLERSRCPGIFGIRWQTPGRCNSEQYQHREFRYSFEVVNARDLNAFALPGVQLLLTAE